MNLQELCSCIPNQVVKGDEAVYLLRSAMEAINKVNENGQIFFAETKEQQKAILNAIEKEIAPFNVKHIVWKGMYGDRPKVVQYWFFMHGLLVIQGIDNTWSLMGSIKVEE